MNKYIQSGKDNKAPEYYDLMLRKKLKKDKSLSKGDTMRKNPSVLRDYVNFVDTVTSDASKYPLDFSDA